ncbi:uncharacterized protein YecT (DUF1311 family) [Filimonas zeae]|uniref:Lysozyme inhibitor LprI N-terminal domain-containing protein n=1 Tax=Filimonas zeae TaxID=1737353 RepID=A0A917MUN1_9BACT|nr:hypothetical protein [Filimonas zeae]MDR6339079.1 uncharacterized protein YecT (DUF1311 family) [Filimonas zeae]GGH65193.1 hypothetical protein GCM10011379_18080 [Filimonas zeae]
MKLYNKPLTNLCAILLITCASVSAQTPVETLQAQYNGCIKAGRNKTECAKRWYQQTDSLLQLTYQQLWNRCDSAQRSNLEDEREEWMERRNAFFEVTMARFRRSSPDDPAEMFASNIGFINKHIAELQLSEPKHYSPELFQVGINGKYELPDDPGREEDDDYVRRLTVRVEDDGNVFFKLFMRSDYGGGSRAILSDVLPLKGNTGVYNYDAVGGTCSIRFIFKRRGVVVQLNTPEPGVNCVYGSNMPIDGFYRRISAKRPGYSAL